MKVTAANNTDTKEAIQWLNQVLYFYQSLCLVKCSEIHRDTKCQNITTILWNEYTTGIDKKQ